MNYKRDHTNTHFPMTDLGLIILVNAGLMSSIETLILQPLDLFPPLPTVFSIVPPQRAG